MKSSDKKTNGSDLQLVWDPQEQYYYEKLQSCKTDRNTQRRLEPYLTFLKDAEPACKNIRKPLLADKQFTL